jgi:hypothetical protein
MTPDELRERILRGRTRIPTSSKRSTASGTGQGLPGRPVAVLRRAAAARLSIKDLDLDEVALYVESTQQQDLGDDRLRLLRAWRLYDGAYPTVGGVVLFGRTPQSVLESTRMVVGALAGDDIGGDFIDRKDLAGGLFDVVAQAEAFLNLYLRTGHEIVGFEPEKREEVPAAAQGPSTHDSPLGTTSTSSAIFSTCSRTTARSGC